MSSGNFSFNIAMFFFFFCWQRDACTSKYEAEYSYPHPEPGPNLPQCPPAIIMKNIGQKKLPSPSLAAGQPLPYISAIPPLFRRGDRPLYIKPGERWSTLSYHGGGKDQIFHLSQSYEFHFIHMLIKLLINKMNDMLFRPLVSPGMEGMLIHIPKPGKP